ncbi:scabin-related ADP-ribosyltransferase [Streptomyces chartreusis]
MSCSRLRSGVPRNDVNSLYEYQYRYEIDAPGGVDAARTGYMDHQEDGEVAFENGIDRSHVTGGEDMTDESSPYYVNPYFRSPSW